jgi:hypothetical protein
MQKLFFVDVCNTLANVIEQLNIRGYRTDIYPCPAPPETYTEELFRSARPIWPIIDWVKELPGQGYSLVYLTARPQKYKTVTLEWLEQHGLPKAPLLHSNGRSKGEVAKILSLNPKVEIAGALEDSPQEIRGYIQAVPGIRLYVPEWEYNAHLSGDGINFLALRQRTA